MRCALRGVSAILLVSVFQALPASAQATNAHPVLTVPITGSFQGGGNFTGTISINRFEQRDAQVVAVGFVSGSLTRANRTLGTTVKGEIAWPVAVRSGTIDLARGSAPNAAVPTVIAFRRESTVPHLMLAQSTPPCQVLDVALGPVTVNLLGVQAAA